MQYQFIQAAIVLACVSIGNAQVAGWGQCGGGGQPTQACASGFCCQVQNEWYHQCIPSAGCSGAVPSVTLSTLRTSTTAATSSTRPVFSSTVRPITTSTVRPVTSTSISPPTSSTPPTTGMAPVDQLVGYGAGTTGGGSGSGVIVTDCAGLVSAIAAGGVIKVSGILSGCGVLRVNAHTSILGVGSNSGMTKGGLYIRRVTNVIVRNMKFYIANESDDLVAIDGTTQVWIDHCEFYNAGTVGDKDFYDGMLDISHGSDFVTVSWNKFHDHWKGSLVGHSDNNAAQDTGKLRVTYHHNNWYNVGSRLPSLRFGTAHVYSSCFADCPISGLNSRMGAKMLVENNSFTNVPLAIVTDLDSDLEGNAVERNNLFLGTSTTRITQSAAYSPPYSYTLDAASSVCAITASKAGTGIVG